MTDFAKKRDAMVSRQVAARGITSQPVLDAMRRVPRERFIPRYEAVLAYDDGPLPIGEGQTISQPYVVAYMTDAISLEGGEKVLEIGTGSGYAAAVLAEIAAEVFTVERIASLADRARATLAELGYDNVRVRRGDGTLGWPEEAPFDGIVVSAGGPGVPDTLRTQLAIGARLVIPIGSSTSFQRLVCVTRLAEDEYQTEGLLMVRFVPLVGTAGWPEYTE